MTDTIKYKDKEYKYRLIFDSEKAEKEKEEYLEKTEAYETEAKHFKRANITVCSVIVAVFVFCTILGLTSNNGFVYWSVYAISALIALGTTCILSYKAFRRIESKCPQTPGSNVDFWYGTKNKTIVKVKFNCNKSLPTKTIWIDLTLCDSDGFISEEFFIRTFKEKKDVDEIILDFDTGTVIVPWIPEDN